MSNILEVRAISMIYSNGSSRVEVLKGVDLDLEQGTTVALVGKSGAGKSTLLHLMGALDRPSGGTILYHGRNLFSKSDRELAQFRNKSIGFVFQSHQLLPEFTALENVMMPSLIARVPIEKARGNAEMLLADVGLAHRQTHLTGELSGGEQQRVAIARALCQSPELLLADEPTGNLDMKTSESVQALLADLQQSMGLTLVIVTHNERLATAMGRVVRLVDGRLD